MTLSDPTNIDRSSVPPKPARLLIVRLSAHGDVMQTLPLLGLIKQAAPDTHIGWVVEESAAALLENHPLIDRLHVSKRKQWLGEAKKGMLAAAWQHTADFLTDISEEEYTHSIDVQGLLKSAVIPWLARIPNRWGYRHTRECGDRFYTHTLPPHRMDDPYTPTVDWFTRFATALYGIDTRSYVNGTQPWPFPLRTIPLEAHHQAAQWLADDNTAISKPIVIVAPGTIWPSKHWPVGYWQHVVAQLAQQWRVVLVGSPAESDLCAQLATHAPDSLNLCGQTDWVTLLALMHRVDLMVGLDSAPLHVAQAVAANTGKPRIVGLFGPTSAGRTGPIGGQGGIQHLTLSTDLPCQPCFERRCPLKGSDHHACMTHLSAEAVLAELALIKPSSQPDTVLPLADNSAEADEGLNE